MSYAFAPARCVASKNGDFRYQGPKNRVLWPSLYGMSSPRENWAGNAHRLFEGFLASRISSPRNRFRANASHVAASRAGHPPKPSGRIRAPGGPSRCSPSRSRPRHLGDARSATGRRGPGADRRRVEPGRGDPRDPLGQFEHLDERMGHPRNDVCLAGPASLHREDVSARRILDVGPAIRRLLREGSQLAPKVPHECRADFAGVSRTLVDARLDDDERQPGPDHGFGDFVMGNPLRPVILRQPRAPMPIRLVDQLTMGVRKDREGARVHPLRNPKFFHGGQHVPSAVDVDALSIRPVLRADLYQPAMWNTPSTPAIGPRRESGSVMSPRRTSTPMASRSRAAGRLRAIATTSWPAWTNCRVTRPPMKPVALVTKYFAIEPTAGTTRH